MYLQNAIERMRMQDILQFLTSVLSKLGSAASVLATKCESFGQIIASRRNRIPVRQFELKNTKEAEKNITCLTLHSTFFLFYSTLTLPVIRMGSETVDTRKKNEEMNWTSM